MTEPTANWRNTTMTGRGTSMPGNRASPPGTGDARPWRGLAPGAGGSPTRRTRRSTPFGERLITMHHDRFGVGRRRRARHRHPHQRPGQDGQERDMTTRTSDSSTPRTQRHSLTGPAAGHVGRHSAQRLANAHEPAQRRGLDPALRARHPRHQPHTNLLGNGAPDNLRLFPLRPWSPMPNSRSPDSGGSPSAFGPPSPIEITSEYS